MQANENVFCHEEASLFSWQRWLDMPAVAKTIENNPEYHRLCHLIDNKIATEDFDAVIYAIQCLFDVNESTAVYSYIQLRHKISVYLNALSITCSASFIVASRFASYSFRTLSSIAAAAIIFLLSAYLVKRRTPKAVYLIEQSYALRKAIMVRDYLKHITRGRNNFRINTTV